MGAGIAQVAATAGHRVLLIDLRAGTAQSAIERIAGSLRRLAAAQKISEHEAFAIPARIRAADSLRDFAECGLVIEAVVEDLDTKRAVFREVESIVSAQALLASNTSSLSITAIAAALQRPERLAGMHFFNPAPRMPLVEIVAGAATSSAVLDTLHATARAWGKTPVHARSTPGFIVNRVARPYYAEALRLLEEQAADCATIDAVLRECGGFRMGTFELMDLIGNDVNYAVTRSVFDGFYGDPRFKPSVLQLELVQAGFLGRKSGRGFYRYESGKAIAAPATAPPASAPGAIRVHAHTPAAEALAQRLARAGIPFSAMEPHRDQRIASCRDCVLYRSDGRTATARAAATGIADTVVVDLLFDAEAATRIAIAPADQAAPQALQTAIGLLQAAGYSVSVVADTPALIVLRTVAMLANEAADALNQGVCSAADLDLAMCLGVHYPQGPLRWADTLGLNSVLQVLDTLAAWYGEDRYRASPLLRRKAITHSTFTAAAAHCDLEAHAVQTCQMVRGEV